MYALLISHQTDTILKDLYYNDIDRHYSYMHNFDYNNSMCQPYFKVFHQGSLPTEGGFLHENIRNKTTNKSTHEGIQIYWPARRRKHNLDLIPRRN